MLRIVRGDRVVRLESPSCPLDPLIFSSVSGDRPLLPYDRVSKSTLGPHPPSIVFTWPDLAPDNAQFVQFGHKFGPDNAHCANFWSPIVSTLPTLGPNPPPIMPTLFPGTLAPSFQRSSNLNAQPYSAIRLYISSMSVVFPLADP